MPRSRRRLVAIPFVTAASLALAQCGGGGGAGGPGQTGAGEAGAFDDGGQVATGDAEAGPSVDGGAPAGEGGPDARAPGDGGGADGQPIAQPTGTSFLDAGGLLGSVEDPGWYLANIPFLEVPDPEIQEVYYYRWETYKEHLVYTGPEYGYLSNEFLEPVSYGAPYGGVVAAAGHQITEGRWLRDPQYVKDDIEYWLNGPGQFPKPATDAVNADTTDWAHEYSFWAASAVWQQYLAAGDAAFTAAQEPALIRQYAGWENHFDSTLGLYWQVPVWDATEYSASSYESSDPYHGGAGYRPTINAYQYGDARAIAAIAGLTGDTATASTYSALAAGLQTNLQAHLWDPTRSFFYDLPRDDNPTNALLDTREEMGFAPWMFDMPVAADAVALQALLDPNAFAAAYGPTTIERSSKWFMYQASGCCHWDGPSWPYETSQTLTGLANLLDDYPPQTFVTAADYLSALHTYAATQFKNGAPYVAEAHAPDDAGWIYDTPGHSEDYNHSTYVDNVISGLVGIRGQPGGTLVVQPLAPATWDYFALENVLYHGHEVTVLWDRTGARYGQGAGLRVYVDGAPAASQAGLAPVTVSVGAPSVQSNRLAGVDIAANGQKIAYAAQPSASYTFSSDSVWNPTDGLVFRVGIPEDTRWTSYSSPNASDSYAVSFQRDIATEYVALDFYDDGGGVRVPASFDLQYWTNGAWATVPGQTRTPALPAANAPTEIAFPPITTSQIRIVAPNAGGGTGWGLSEVWVRSKPVFNVVNVNSSLLLAVQGALQASGTQVQQYHSAGSLDQFWELVPAGGGDYEIVNVNSGLVLAPAASATTDSALIEQVDDTTGASSPLAGAFVRWTLIDTSANGQFKIKNVGSGLLLGVAGESTADSADVVQFEDNGTADHLWMLEPAAYPQLAFDDFEAGVAQWSPASGTWAQCKPAGSEEYCATAAAESVSLRGQIGWRSYTVDALVRVGSAAPGAGAGIVARAQDGTHYYVAELTWNQDGLQAWDISKNDGGNWTVLASGVHAWVEAGAPQVALRFAVQGGHLTIGIVTASGAVHTLGSVYDTQFASGQAGLRTNGLTASFDAVRVTGG